MQAYSCLACVILALDDMVTGLHGITLNFINLGRFASILKEFFWTQGGVIFFGFKVASLVCIDFRISLKSLTLSGSWPQFFLSAVEQAIATYAEKRQNVDLKPYCSQ